MLRGMSVMKKRIITSTVAVVTAAAVIGGAVYFNGDSAYARPTLRGIEDLVSNHTVAGDGTATPIVIYEVVPRLEDARLGYLVGGEEPVYQGKSIKDMPSKAERTDNNPSTPTTHTCHGLNTISPTFLKDDAYTWETYNEPTTLDPDTTYKTIDIRGDFKDRTGGDYSDSNLAPDAYELKYAKNNADVETLYDDKNTEGVVLYRKAEAYRIGDGYSGKFSFNIARSVSVPVETSSGVYNNQYFTASEVDSEYSYSDGLLIYRRDNSSSEDYLEYFGYVNNGEVVKADGSSKVIGTESGQLFDFVDPTNPDHFYVVNESSELSDNCYFIDKTTLVTCSYSLIGKKEGFAKVEGSIYDSTNAAAEDGPYYVNSDATRDAYSYTPDNGSYEFVANYSNSEVYQTFSYEGGFTNNEWFKNYVLDRDPADYASVSIDVIPVTPDMLTVDMIDKANLIYFAGDVASYQYEDDKLSVDVAKKIVSSAVTSEVSVMMETSSLNAADAGELKTKDIKSVSRLAAILMQNEIPDSDTLSALWDNGAADGWATLYDNMYSVPAGTVDSQGNSYNDRSHVNGTIFINDDTVAGKIVASDFSTTYDPKKTSMGFQAIVDEINAEKTYIELYSDWSKFNSAVSKATAIRYILNGNKTRAVVKSTLNILDIEPYATEQYSNQDVLRNNLWKSGTTYNNLRLTLVRDIMTKDWLTENIAGHLKGKEDQINLRQMGTIEFIGKNEDLNSTYDMIYIGMDTAIMNTDDTGIGAYSTKSTTTVYNNIAKGLVYSHVGDSINYSNDWALANGKYNLSGNDITPDKYRELKEYIEAGYAMVISDGFIKNDGSINTTTLDTSSYMYKLVKDVILAKKDGVYLYYGKNVFRRSSLEATSPSYATARDTISKYINVSKLTIEAESVPYAYNNPDGPKYLDTNADGSHTMKFVVKLKNDAAVDASSTTYDCKLYLDMDADGKFEEGESLGGLEINGESSEKFSLKAGNTYTITRNAPEDYVGFLSWKLAFIQNEKETDGERTTFNNVRSSITGFSAIKNTGKKPIINVLQIAPNPDQNNNLDLTDASMEELYTQVEDFDVKVHKVTVSQYIKKEDVRAASMVMDAYNARDLTYYDYLAKYDMVVIGFTDNFHFNAVDDSGSGNIEVYYPTWFSTKPASIPRDRVYQDAILGIREYVLSGRSILFTHDLSSRLIDKKNNKDDWSGYFANLYLRDLMGMDRYKYTATRNADYYYLNDFIIKRGVNDHSNPVKVQDYQSVYDEAKINGNTVGDIKGLTNAAVMRKATDNTWAILTRNNTAEYAIDGTVPNGNTNKIETVTALNEGQITQYPFLITEGTSGETDKSTFEVSSTHSQYYQLNMDTDSRDENANDDVVVWYTISNKGINKPGADYTGRHEYYQSMYNDARNNYYIYSKGNVTYTGSGHSLVKGDLEKKLFVNTLVAAYNNGLHAPKVIFKENPWDTAATVSSTYLPYDPTLTNNEAATEESAVTADEGGFLDETLTVNFKTINNNFRESRNNLFVKYYVRTDSTTSGLNGLVEITPTSLKLADVSGNLIPAGDMYVLGNYKIYQATFKLTDITMKTGTSNKLNKDDVEIVIRIGTEPLTAEQTATDSLSGLAVYATKLFDLK